MITIGRVAVWAAVPLAIAAYGDQPQPAASVHAVMYEFTYDYKSLVITHAQVIGGYRSVELCRKAIPAVLATVAPQLSSRERARLECSGVTSGKDDGAEERHERT